MILIIYKESSYSRSRDAYFLSSLNTEFFETKKEILCYMAKRDAHNFVYHDRPNYDLYLIIDGDSVRDNELYEIQYMDYNRNYSGGVSKDRIFLKGEMDRMISAYQIEKSEIIEQKRLGEKQVKRKKEITLLKELQQKYRGL